MAIMVRSEDANDKHSEGTSWMVNQANGNLIIYSGEKVIAVYSSFYWKRVSAYEDSK